MPAYSIDGVVPVVAPEAYVHPTAVLIGDVLIEADCYIGPFACLRGDFGRITIRRGANVQDTCVIHSFPLHETIVEENGHIGHGAILHGCVVKRDALVGMAAVVMDNAEIGERSIVGACSFVPAGSKIPPESLAIGVPAKQVRALSTSEIQWKKEGTLNYQDLARRSAMTMKEVTPYSKPEADRPQLQPPVGLPLSSLQDKGHRS